MEIDNYWYDIKRNEKRKTNIRKRHHENMIEYEMDLAREEYERDKEKIYNYRREVG